jgi:hypothetical protein
MRRRTSATTWLTRSSVAGGGAISYDPPELERPQDGRCRDRTGRGAVDAHAVHGSECRRQPDEARLRDGVFDAVVDIKALPCRGGDVDDAARPPCQRRKRVLIASITARS